MGRSRQNTVRCIAQEARGSGISFRRGRSRHRPTKFGHAPGSGCRCWGGVSGDPRSGVLGRPRAPTVQGEPTLHGGSQTSGRHRPNRNRILMNCPATGTGHHLTRRSRNQPVPTATTILPNPSFVRPNPAKFWATPPPDFETNFPTPSERPLLELELAPRRMQVAGRASERILIRISTSALFLDLAEPQGIQTSGIFGAVEAKECHNEIPTSARHPGGTDFRPKPHPEAAFSNDAGIDRPNPGNAPHNPKPRATRCPNRTAHQKQISVHLCCVFAHGGYLTFGLEVRVIAVHAELTQLRHQGPERLARCTGGARGAASGGTWDGGGSRAMTCR